MDIHFCNNYVWYDRTYHAKDAGVLEYLPFEELFPVDDSEGLQMSPTAIGLHVESNFKGKSWLDYSPRQLVSDCLSRFPSVQSFTITPDPLDTMSEYGKNADLFARLRHLRINCHDERSVGIGTLEKLLTNILKQPVLKLETITLPGIGIGGEGARGSMDRLVFKGTRGSTQVLYHS